MPVDQAVLPGEKAKKSKYFYGWNIVAAAFMSQLAYAEHFSSNLGLFFKPFQEEFGWDRTEVAIIQTIARLVEGIGAPFIGPFIDRWGPRILMPLGAIVCVIGSFMSSRSNSLWELYLFRGVFTAIGFTLMGTLVIDVTIARWFIRKRGRATGITRIGSYVCMFIMTPLTVYIIANYGWRAMFIIFALFTLTTALLPAAIFMRRRPEDMGLFPDGVNPDDVHDVPNKNTDEEKSLSPHNPANLATERIWSRREIIKSPAFWLVTATYAIDMFIVQAINISMAPYVQDLMYGTEIVAAVLTIRGVIMAVGSFCGGFVAEYAQKPVVRTLPFVLECIAAVFFLMAGSPVFLWLAVGLYGIFSSANQVTQAVVWANYFGRPSLGTVRSIAYLFIFGFGAMGPLVMNAIYDLAGSYSYAFIGMAILWGVAGLMIYFSRPPKQAVQSVALTVE